MEGFDYWRLCDELNIIQAALLVVGCDPSSDVAYVQEWDVERRPTGYEAAKIAISNALRAGNISGKYVPIFEFDMDRDISVPIERSIDLNKSHIEVPSLRAWLLGRGVKTGFFFPDVGSDADYLSARHPRYASKLAAAVKAWLAVEGESLSGRSPKQVLVKWLRQHAAEFGLSDEDGKPNETGIEEIAKVANWQPGGGAPKTLAGY